LASAAPKPLELPTKLRELHDFLDGKGDVDILEIHGRMFGTDVIQLRKAQQYLGPYITKLNRRLKEHRRKVVPGRIKGTYVLTAL